MYYDRQARKMLCPTCRSNRISLMSRNYPISIATNVYVCLDCGDWWSEPVRASDKSHIYCFPGNNKTGSESK